jgi:phenylacetate-CoA ligase
MTSFFKDIDQSDISAIQLKGLQWTIAHAWKGSSLYRRKLEAAGIHPEQITSLEDIRRLPFTDKQDLQEGYPFPLRAVPFEEIVRIHASSGTTGKRKVLCYTQRDIDIWKDLFARCYELAGLTTRDRVQIAVGYGLWTAGVGFQAGCERLGSLAIPVGPANAEMHCEMMVDMESTVFCSTASMALLMAEEILKRDLRDKIKIEKVILGAERCSDAMRRRIKELMQVEHIFDIYGLTELYGPGTGIDCTLHKGIHYWADHFIFEIIDPVTLEPLPHGETGELVVTTLKKEASPLIRYRTHDVTRILEAPCPCGNPFPMHDKILGRTDDMFIYRAVNIYPSQIDHVLSHMDGVGSEFQILLKQRENGRDTMVVRVEKAMGGSGENDARLAERVSDEIRRKVLVRGQVEILEYGHLPRTQRKITRVFDQRNNFNNE